MPTLKLLFAYPYDSVRELCHSVKKNAFTIRRDRLEPLAMALPDKAILVPVPGHEGRAEHTLDLAYRLQAIAKALSKDARVIDALKGSARESLCALKQQGKDISGVRVEFTLNPEEIDREGVEILSKTFRFVLVDNVIDTGKTAGAAIQALKVDCGAVAIGTTGASGLQLPPQYYEIVRFSSQDSEQEGFDTVRDLVEHGQYRNAIDFMSLWDYGGENLDAARCFGKLWPTPKDPVEQSDRELLSEGDYHLCIADSHAYKAFYLTKNAQ